MVRGFYPPSKPMQQVPLPDTIPSISLPLSFPFTFSGPFP